MNTEELKQSHLGDASELFAAAYRRERETAPSLDERFLKVFE